MRKHQQLAIFALAGCLAAITWIPSAMAWDTGGRTVLLGQDWSGEERQAYYRTSQGSALLSYDIFLHLEVARAPGLFRADANMAGYGLIPQPAEPTSNPDGLPIGWTRTVVPQGRWKGEWAGISCAACHSAQLEYKGTKIRVDGGFNQHFDLFAFLAGLDDAVAATVADSVKFARLASRLACRDPLTKAALRRRLIADAERIHSIRSKYFRPAAAVGPGRMDALDLVRNQIVANQLGVPQNWLPLNAPVKWPFLWNAPQSAWIGWRGTQQFPLLRNAGESMGLWVAMDLSAPSPAAGLFDSTLDLKGQIAIENLLRKLAPPAWPEKVLGAIDRDKATRGAGLFNQYCAACHSRWPHRWSEPKKMDKRFIENALVSAEIIGTDRTQVDNLAYGSNPVFQTARMSELLPAPYKGAALAPALVILTTAIQGAMERALRTLQLTPRELEDASGYRNESEPMPPAGLYKAAPSDGMWAVAPYLHNGSVPSLYQLLLPAKMRDKKFLVGRRYDPIKVGIDTTGSSGSFLFDTTLVGNSNAGHSFEDGPRTSGVIGPLLTEDERWALIEYMKSLPSRPDLVTPFGGPKSPIRAWEDPTFYNNQARTEPTDRYH